MNSTLLRDEKLTRKVTASGVIWLDGRSYYVSRRLAGRVLPVIIREDKLVVDAAIPLRKEYSLPSSSASRRRARSWRTAPKAG